MNILNILKEGLDREASDIILTSGVKPVLKINWEIVYLEQYDILLVNDLNTQIISMMNDKQKFLLKENLELDFAIELKGYSRFRVNVFFSKNGIWVVFRPVKAKLPNFKELWLPEKLLDFINKKNWLILVTGPVWSGKSTTMSALIDTITISNSKHIITIEDPIEFVFNNNKSLVEQREIGVNTRSYENGLKYALRQASDVIMIGEMRDLETFRLALRAAETWNLVITTLHTSGAARTISRIIDMFPWDEKEQIRSQLADSLIWIIWQELIKTKDGDSRVLASELLVNNMSISNMIRKWVLHQIQWAIETWNSDWMYTMDSSLEKLKSKGLIK